MTQKYLGLNETMQVHEILNLISICMTTADTALNLTENIYVDF